MTSTAALVLVGHGSARHPGATRPLLELAEAVRRRNRFAEVAAVFFKNPPGPDQALALVRAAEVVVVPVFAGRGHYTDTLIPRAFGLSGRRGDRDGRTVAITPPVGAHPRLPALLAARAGAVAAAEGLDPAAISLLLLAHGSARGAGAGETPRAVAAALAGMGMFAEVALAFLEQEPRAESWPALVAGAEVVALPLLVVQGMHASEDIPPLFGLAPGQRGPVPAAGRRVRLATGLGAEADLVDIVVELAEAELAGR